MAVDMSGVSTPLSSTATLSGTSSPKLTTLEKNIANGPAIPASTAIEYIASRSSLSSSVFVYDLAEQAGFGTLTKSWAESSSDVASVVSLQTRAGAGLSLVGRLSQGSSKDTKGAVLTAFTTPTGLAAMVQSLSYLPPATASSRLIIQVPTVTPVGENFSLSPTLAPLAPVFSMLPDSFTVLLSAAPQEAVDLTALSYKLTDTHVIHLFDHYSSARETGHSIIPAVPSQEAGLTVKEGLTKAGYGAFDYAGDKEAHTVIVLLNGPLALVAKAIASHVSGLGVVVVRLLRPWDEDALRQIIPASTRHIHVLDDVPTETTQGALYMDVFASVLDPMNSGPVVKSHRIVSSHTQEFLTRPAIFVSFLCELVPTAVPASIDAPNLKKLLFFSVPDSPLSVLPRMVEQTFLTHPSISARLVTDHDVFAKVTVDRLLLSPKDDKSPFVPLSVTLPITPGSPGEADFVAVSDQALLKSHSIITHAKAGSVLLIVTSWTADELVSNVSLEVAALVHEKNLRLYIITAKELAADLSDVVGTARKTLEDVIVYLAFLRLYLAQVATEELVIKLAQSTLGPIVQGVNLLKVGSRTWSALVQVDTPAPAKDVEGAEAETAKSVALKDFVFNTIAVEIFDGDTVASGARLGSWHDAAKHIIFPTAFTPEGLIPGSELSQDPSLRPDLAERTYLITCTVNRRLTPEDYDRNVFHLEFDTSGTGLKYEIGEALGVHGWNDTQEVLDFCAWYGINPDRLITIPVLGSDGIKLHTRTVFQALQQQIDLFGKPGKSFYTDLSEYASTKADKYALQFIGSPEGAATFKKLSEKDTVTFADILMRYSSAKPGIEALCELIGDIKPRHYSIASAQAVVGDRVDLLVVSVEWVTPSGCSRYGQCTRYLAGLKVGQKVTVSIKPSVMKLPSDNMQPIIMAGLGTGAAPFRAFLQHRAWLAAQNIPVGPTYYYFGSRHQSQEYLYGEEIEAYLQEGTITRAGLAFSRDGPRKVYIQHKMRVDSEELARMLWDDRGVFYLCGPTWPVPDVYEALVEALVKHTGEEQEAAGAFLEGLKEEERYVLEVY
ncbi:Probable sulfite reductase [NADPH] flavoprotein [Sparassis crispa]|uniref:assimilatory sulfite reductase (NADPH) n=1 Tax=Sparassis crispa TaxID=139825 RepID=A0A401GB04_9APHY|nr:Probable sulfite reductase [NADPH] flavoprotein [Sparassis crispa]GBE79342.1 Probable sulfite reductase [NADPH] flavoprotein [Sparassis crispa]